MIEEGSKLPTIPLFHLPPKVGNACTYLAEKIEVSKLAHPLLIVIVPGAFTPTCSERHIPGFLTTTAIGFLQEKGIKQVLILSTDSPFITRAWGDDLIRQYDSVKDYVSNGYIKFVSDAGGEWLKEAGLVNDGSDLYTKNGLRGLRSAIIVNESNNVEYLGIDKVSGSVENSGIEGVLKALK